MKMNNFDTRWVDRTLNKLSLREKLGQMLVPMLTKDSIDPDPVDVWINKYKIGGGHVFGGTVESTSQFIDAAQAASNIPLLISGDMDKGCGDRIKEGTFFQYQMALGSVDSDELAYALGRAIAVESLAVGINWTFSPIVDICGMPDYQRHVAAISEDPEQVARLAIAEINGIQEHGMAACAKHFPGDGHDARDQHLTTIINPLSASAWREKSGWIFKQTINAGVYSIMNSCIALPSIEDSGDPNFPKPSIISKKLTTDILRGELGFEGVIVTDALNMGGVTNHLPQLEGYAQALEAGNDALLFVTRYDQTLDYLENCVRTGRVTEQQIEDSVRRILTMKAKLNLQEPVAEEKQVSRFDLFTDSPCKKDAQELAEKSVTLIQDKKNVVPLKMKNKRVAHVLITNRAEEFDGAVFEQTLREADCEVTQFLNPDPEPMYDEIASGNYDIVITSLFFPIQWGWSSVRTQGPYIRSVMSGYPLAHPDVPSVYVSFAGPYHLQELAYMDAFLVTYGDAPAAQEAAAKALTGQIPILGKVPVSLEGFFQKGDGIQKPLPAQS